MKFQGLNRKSTPIDETPGTSHYQENTRLHINGELRRRNGFARANIAQLATPIYAIASTVAPVPSIVLQGSTGSIDGFTTFTPLWGDMQLLAPTGTATAPSAYVTGDGLDSGSLSISVTGFPNQQWWSTASPGTMVGGIINSGGTNGSFYRVTIAVNVTATNLNADHIRYTLTNGGGLLDLSGYGWILQSTTCSLTTTTDPTDNTYLMQTPFAAANEHIVATTKYRTAGGATFAFGTGAFGVLCQGQTHFFPFDSITGTARVFAELEQVSSAWTITVNRSEAFDTSYDIYASDSSYPIDPSDGTYIGNLPINPGDASASASMTAPSSASTWKWIAVPRSGSMVGPAGRLT